MFNIGQTFVLIDDRSWGSRKGSIYYLDETSSMGGRVYYHLGRVKVIYKNDASPPIDHKEHVTIEISDLTSELRPIDLGELQQIYYKISKQDIK